MRGFRPPKFQRSFAVAPGRLLRLLGVAAVFVGAVSLMSDDPGLQLTAPLFGLLTCVQLYPILRRGAVDVFEPPVQLGIYAAFTTLATVTAFSEQGSLTLRFLEYLPDEQTTALVVRTVLSSMLGLVFYYLGYYHPRWGTRASRGLPDFSRPRWSRARLHIAVAIFLSIFTVTYVVFQGRLGVELSNATELAAGKAVWREDPTTSWMVRGVELGFLASMLYIAVYAWERRHVRLAASAALLLACAYLISRLGQRGAYVGALLFALGLVHYLRKRVPVWVFVAFLLLGTAVSNLQLQWRTSQEGRRADAREVVQGVARPVESLAVHEQERQRFATLALVFREFPDHYDHLLGETYLGLVATFVPRWLWPEKADHFQWRDTMIVTRLVGARIPSPYLAVLWVNWSYPGIIIGMLLWGVFHRALYEARNRGRDDPFVNLVFLAVSTTISPTLHGVSSAIQVALPIIAAVLFIGGLRRRVSVGQPLPARQAAPSPT